MKKILTFCIWIGILIAAWGYYSVSSVGSLPVEAKKISLTPGTSVLALNQKAGINVADWRFRLYVKYYFPDFALKAGTYSIKERATVRDLFSTALKTPTTTDITLTVLPGWNLYDIDADWSNDGLIATGSLSRIDAKTFSNLKKKFNFLQGLTTLEGTILPETYRVRQWASLEEMLSAILTVFDNRVYKKIPANKRANFYPTLILASIVEKEERNENEKPIVAGILSKRLREWMAIGADATVCYPYALTNKECNPTFIAEHISESGNAYNTRKKPGLPPTPISNPSVSTWLAALNPEPSEYYYYLHDSKGVIHYGQSLEEHNRNKVLYLGN